MDVQAEKKSIKNLKAFLMDDWELTEDQKDELDDLAHRIFMCGKAEAKASAVPEGFVLIERDLIQSIHQSCVNCLDVDVPPIFRATVSTIRDEVAQLIEAQEQLG